MQFDAHTQIVHHHEHCRLWGGTNLPRYKHTRTHIHISFSPNQQPYPQTAVATRARIFVYVRSRRPSTVRAAYREWATPNGARAQTRECFNAELRAYAECDTLSYIRWYGCTCVLHMHALYYSDDEARIEGVYRAVLYFAGRYIDCIRCQSHVGERAKVRKAIGVYVYVYVDTWVVWCFRLGVLGTRCVMAMKRDSYADEIYFLTKRRSLKNASI